MALRLPVVRMSPRVALLKLAQAPPAPKVHAVKTQRKWSVPALKRARDGYLLELGIDEEPSDWLRRLGAFEARQGWPIPPGAICVSRVHEIWMLAKVNPLKMGWRHVARPLFFIPDSEWQEVYEAIDDAAWARSERFKEAASQSLRWYGEYRGVEWL